MYVLCMRIYLCDELLKPLSKRSEPPPSQCHSWPPHPARCFAQITWLKTAKTYRGPNAVTTHRGGQAAGQLWDWSGLRRRMGLVVVRGGKDVVGGRRVAETEGHMLWSPQSDSMCNLTRNGKRLAVRVYVCVCVDLLTRWRQFLTSTEPHLWAAGSSQRNQPTRGVASVWTRVCFPWHSLVWCCVGSGVWCVECGVFLWHSLLTLLGLMRQNAIIHWDLP